MKKIFFISAVLFLLNGFSFAQVSSDHDDENQPTDFFTNETNDLSQDDEDDFVYTYSDPKREEVVNNLIRYVTNSIYKGINHDGIFTMTAESVVIYSSELMQYEPFKSFRNQLVSTQYILNKASELKGLEPVYSINGETNPDKWPRVLMTGTTTVSKTANGYRRSGFHGISSTIDTITYIDFEKQKLFEEQMAAEKIASDKRKNDLLQKYITTISNAKYDVYFDGTKKRYFLATENLVEAYSKEVNKLLSKSFNNENTVKYILNKASIEQGLEPVYSVNNDYDPDNWNLPRYKFIDEAPAANGYRIATPSELSSMDKKNTETNYIISRYDGKTISEKKAEKVAAGKFYLDSIGLSVSENKNQSVVLFFKGGTKITTTPDVYKVFSLTSEKKSAAQKAGFKDDDIFVIHGVKNSKVQGTTKIIIDSTVVDMTNFGSNATVEDVYAAFSKAMSAKKVTIQIRRKSMGSYDLKEIELK